MSTAAWTGTESVNWNQQTIESYDAVVIATAHRMVNHAELARWAILVIDTRNVLASTGTGSEAVVWKA